MEMISYQKRVEEFMNPETLEDVWRRMTNALLGLAGETGELCDAWKKHTGHNHNFDKQKFILEIGDAYFYLAEVASSVGVTLEDVALLNIEKLMKRYPTGKFTTQDSLEKKDELDKPSGVIVVTSGENLHLNSAGVVYEGR